MITCWHGRQTDAFGVESCLPDGSLDALVHSSGTRRAVGDSSEYCHRCGKGGRGDLVQPLDCGAGRGNEYGEETE